ALPMDTRSWGFLVGMGLIHTCVMYILLYSAIQSLPTAMVAVLSFVYPAVAILVDHVFYGQHLGPLQWLGIVLILASSASINRTGTKPQPLPARVVAHELEG
ncbi:MAG TPA: DMT family transporter, partial [Burkholderiaceae bacterium]|nr:DMT family transporter [Burkholderiaceae bacterium]